MTPTLEADNEQLRAALRRLDEVGSLKCDWTDDEIAPDKCPGVTSPYDGEMCHGCEARAALQEGE